MKKKMFKRSFWKTIFSVIILGVFIFLGIASTDYGYSTKTYIGSGIYEVKENLQSGTITTTGQLDDRGRWQGPVTIKSTNLGGNHSVFEEVYMINGRRDGESKTLWQDGTITTTMYNNGWEVLENKSATNDLESSNAYEIFHNKYSFFLNQLYAFGFSNEHVKSCLDTMEMMINELDFDTEDFDDNYQNIVDNMQGTIYDSLLYSNSVGSLLRGTERLKNSEFRMAVIDHYINEGTGTFANVKTTYPNYLLTLNEKGVNEPDFEIFCHSFDSLLTSYGDLDVEDPGFLDSLDNRMYRAIEFISNDEKSALSALVFAKSIILTNTNKDSQKAQNLVNKLTSNLLLKSNSKNVADVIVAMMLADIPKDDLIKQSVKEAWFNKMNIIVSPIVTTQFLNNISVSSVSVKSYIIEDGGAEITSKGIAWGTFYNPTIQQQTISSGSGAEDFTTSLSGLTTGETYYVRTYATNSAGTSYGNCISFKAGNTVGIEDFETNNPALKIYPNPASGIATFSFYIEPSEKLLLTIVNMNGQVIIEKNIEKPLQKVNHVQINTSELRNGIYYCSLNNNKGTKISEKLLIIH